MPNAYLKEETRTFHSLTASGITARKELAQLVAQHDNTRATMHAITWGTTLATMIACGGATTLLLNWLTQHHGLQMKWLLLSTGTSIVVGTAGYLLIIRLIKTFYERPRRRKTQAEVQEKLKAYPDLWEAFALADRDFAQKLSAILPELHLSPKNQQTSSPLSFNNPPAP